MWLRLQFLKPRKAGQELTEDLQQITRFENMSNSPTIFFLVKYANALDTELDVVLNGVELIEVANNE